LYYQACDCLAGWSGPTCLYSTDCRSIDGFCDGAACSQANGACLCDGDGYGPHCSYREADEGEAYDATADKVVDCNTGRVQYRLAGALCPTAWLVGYFSSQPQQLYCTPVQEGYYPANKGN
jgi:hypothetical protein